MKNCLVIYSFIHSSRKDIKLTYQLLITVSGMYPADHKTKPKFLSVYCRAQRAHIIWIRLFEEVFSKWRTLGLLEYTSGDEV